MNLIMNLINMANLKGQVRSLSKLPYACPLPLLRDSRHSLSLSCCTRGHPSGVPGWCVLLKTLTNQEHLLLMSPCLGATLTKADESFIHGLPYASEAKSILVLQWKAVVCAGGVPRPFYPCGRVWLCCR